MSHQRFPHEYVKTEKQIDFDRMLLALSQKPSLHGLY
jgi:hypothetical protein